MLYSGCDFFENQVADGKNLDTIVLKNVCNYDLYVEHHNDQKVEKKGTKSQ